MKIDRYLDSTKIFRSIIHTTHFLNSMVLRNWRVFYNAWIKWVVRPSVLARVHRPNPFGRLAQEKRRGQYWQTSINYSVSPTTSLGAGFNWTSVIIWNQVNSFLYLVVSKLFGDYRFFKAQVPYKLMVNRWKLNNEWLLYFEYNHKKYDLMHIVKLLNW